jgi:D-arabinose 1-dehydrogenase-like Zn-dependent alcohol dehydrogenase
MRVVQVGKPGGPFELVERETPKPGRGEALLRVHACGICHSDLYVKEGAWPGIAYPRVPGHEVVGEIAGLGEDVQGFKIGDRVGVGWHGGHCGYCDSCRRGQFVVCQTESARQVTGISRDGGYGEFMIAAAGTLAHVPDGLSATEAAPLMCAGVTTFNSLRHCGAKPGDLVAVLGVGGLGHLGIQYASKMGFDTVAIARGEDKAQLAQTLGARAYIDSNAQDPGKALQKMGGARVILATVTSGKAMTVALGGLGLDGTLVVLGAADTPLAVIAGHLIGGRHSIMGWPSGSAIDSEDTMKFSALFGVKTMTEAFPLARANDAYERMLSGKARFRAVLTTS